MILLALIALAVPPEYTRCVVRRERTEACSMYRRGYVDGMVTMGKAVSADYRDEGHSEAADRIDGETDDLATTRE